MGVNTLDQESIASKISRKKEIRVKNTVYMLSTNCLDRI
jgi:hypothetical protein